MFVRIAQNLLRSLDWKIADEETLTEMERKISKAVLWLASKRIRTFSIVTASSYEVSSFLIGITVNYTQSFLKELWEIIKKSVNEKSLSAKYVLKIGKIARSI